MRSDERRTLVAEKNKLIFSAAEARASTHTALDLLLTSRGGEQASSSTQGGDRLPPAKYKTLLVVVASLYSTTMALEFVWSGTVVRGLAFPLRMAIEVTVAAVIIGYLVIPALSTIGKR